MRIVGTGIRTVEQVTGRMTTGRAALAGAGSGAWIGLLFGLLFTLFTIGPWVGAVLGAVVIGAVWGALFGFVAHWATRGRRDFSSVRGVEAARYAVETEPALLDRARAVASRI
ncbi:general stress protein [Pseudonocardia sediminis]|uniref:general stress protein n=1 Tax=Pseudonocardia sediminis TaxID=1397368 RepID=UPI0013EF336E|nr:general stress protein [Pseudonocardia sediminis]